MLATGRAVRVGGSSRRPSRAALLANQMSSLAAGLPGPARTADRHRHARRLALVPCRQLPAGDPRACGQSSRSPARWPAKRPRAAWTCWRRRRSAAGPSPSRSSPGTSPCWSSRVIIAVVITWLVGWVRVAAGRRHRLWRGPRVRVLIGLLMLAAGSVAFATAPFCRTHACGLPSALIALFGGYLITSYDSLSSLIDALGPLSWFALDRRAIGRWPASPTGRRSRCSRS